MHSEAHAVRLYDEKGAVAAMQRETRVVRLALHRASTIVIIQIKKSEFRQLR